MEETINHLGQPIGFVVPNWSPRKQPPPTAMEGRLCRVVSLDIEQHSRDIYQANSEDKEGRMWTYLMYGPFLDFEDYLAQMNKWLGEDWRVHAILDTKTGRAVGLASYMRVEPEEGSIEVGAIMYSPQLQHTTAGTEAMYLMMKRAFDELGYRRYEWRCNALNEASKNAARRLGFQFEGIFRQTGVLKGRNRDTAWFSILDREWPAIKMAIESWLALENFDSKGNQIKTLRQFMLQKPGSPAATAISDWTARNG
jgi:RimJ/RimL family protein N-acetyltransferase